MPSRTFLTKPRHPVAISVVLILLMHWLVYQYNSEIIFYSTFHENAQLNELLIWGGFFIPYAYLASNLFQSVADPKPSTAAIKATTH